MRRAAILLAAVVVTLAGLAFGSAESLADTSPVLTTFRMKDLEEREHNLADAQYKDKILLVAAFGTWQDVSRRQAREIEAFHKAHPEVEIVAFVVDELAVARDFVKAEGLTFPCYQSDATTRISTNFNRLFETRKGKTLSLNRAPFVMLTDKERRVKFADLGLITEAELSEELAALND